MSRPVQLGAGVLHLAESIALFGLISSDDNRLTWPLTKQGFEQTLGVDNYQLIWLVPFIPLLSTANHFAYAGSAQYSGFVQSSRTNPVQWAEYALSSSLMLWIIASLSGVTNVEQLTGLVLTNMVLMALGYVIEKRFADGAEPREILLLQLFSWMLFAAIWVPIFTTFFTVLDTTDNVPWAVNAIVPTLFVLFAAFGVVNVLYTTKTIDYGKSLLGYTILSFVSKTFLNWFLYFGVKRGPTP